MGQCVFKCDTVFLIKVPKGNKRFLLVETRLRLMYVASIDITPKNDKSFPYLSCRNLRITEAPFGEGLSTPISLIP